MINELKIFLDVYQSYNEIKLVESKEENDQAIFYGHIKAIEAIKNMIEYLEDQE